ncbi:serine/threonine-protein kinase [Anaeramoeba ignava]|uniref:Serine/threonine-protein kinase n=1 Tax=Anaeramoeba ignava TaxID=1746090 RepID=A0A9Q0LUZ4_ANAIG|nr:serine/threonine-protein kinase [Anaeramoeba ignava]
MQNEIKNQFPSGNNFKAKRKIGKGSYGTVYLGKTLKTKEICAIKKIDLSQTENQEKTRRNVLLEIQIMKKVKHENCVKLFFIEPENYQKSDLIYVVMEYCNMNDLNHYIQSKNKRISIEEMKEIFRQIFQGLKYLYEQGIVHRDLKPENILLQKNDSKFGYTIKLADFGFARKIPKDDLGKSLNMQSLVGSPIYAAPEILFGESYTSKADLWSLGVILYEIVTGGIPFSAFGINDLVLIYKNTTKKSLPKKVLNVVPKECNDLVEKLLTVDPELRISRQDLHNHPFISEQLKESVEKSQSLLDLEKGIIGITKEDFESKENDKLSFKKGEVIEIIKIKKDKEICEGILKEEKGIIELKSIDLYQKIENIFSIIESNNQIKKFQKRIIGITKYRYQANQFSLPKGELIEITLINGEMEICEIQFENQKDEIPFFFLDFYEQIGGNNGNQNQIQIQNQIQNENQNENQNKLIGIARVDSQDNEDEHFLSFSKGDEVEILEINEKIGIAKLNGKEGEILIDDFDIKEK